MSGSSIGGIGVGVAGSGSRGGMEYVPVAQFYNERSVFVTGGTGFMGKVLVEKLLRACPGIRHIYLLMRPKRDQGVSARLHEIKNSPLFDRLRRERPGDLHKIVPVEGDITQEELGISEADQQVLIRDVSVVFHSAATVKFDEALKLSVTINMLGTKRLVALCQKMLGLEALVHVSTAYCNCDRKEVEERVYAPPFDPQQIIACMEWMDADLIEAVTPKLIGKRPNTYTFTKALAEDMLMKEGKNLPVAIVRPSIVVSSIGEPVAGWVDNWNGPTGLIAAAGKGFFRTMWGDPNATADFVPVDIVINLMIVAAWRTATDRSEMKVYNCVSGIQNPVTWGQFVDTCLDQWRVHPLSGAVWYPGGHVRSSWILNQFYAFFMHRVPAYILDAVALISGNKPIMRSVSARLEKAGEVLEYFTGQQWRFLDDNSKKLNQVLTPEDRAMFPFDVCQIDWKAFLRDYVLGIRTFIFKEPSNSLPYARSHMRRLQWISKLTEVAAVIVLWRLLVRRTGHGRRLGYILLDLVLRIYRLIPFV